MYHYEDLLAMLALGWHLRTWIWGGFPLLTDELPWLDNILLVLSQLAARGTKYTLCDIRRKEFLEVYAWFPLYFTPYTLFPLLILLYIWFSDINHSQNEYMPSPVNPSRKSPNLGVVLRPLHTVWFSIVQSQPIHSFHLSSESLSPTNSHIHIICYMTIMAQHLQQLKKMEKLSDSYKSLRKLQLVS